MARIGRYELLRPLGRGGMAEVFLARRRGPGGIEKRLAVKRIRRERTGDPRFVEMFVAEARLSMALAHKNVVQVFDFGRVGDELFLVMEYVAGFDLGTALGTLRDPAGGAGPRGVVGRGPAGSLDPVLVAFIGMEACQALDHAHRWRGPDGDQTGIVHRDVTPRNVLLSASGEVKLADFGVAGHVTEPGVGRLRGTPAYMSPEQVRGESLDGRSDVFSLGLVLWEALSGHRAYGGAEPADMLDLARAARVPPLADPVPGALAAIVARATAFDRASRFADARTMQLALDQFVIDARARSGGAPPSHRIAAWIRDLASAGATGVDTVGDGGRELEGPAGEVVTFLDDGADGVAESLVTSNVVTLAESAPDQAAQVTPDRAGDPADSPADISSGDPGDPGDPGDAPTDPEHRAAERSEEARVARRSRSRARRIRGLAAAAAGLLLAAASWGLWTRWQPAPGDPGSTAGVRLSRKPGVALKADTGPGDAAIDATAQVASGAGRDAGSAGVSAGAAVPAGSRRPAGSRSRRDAAAAPRIGRGTVKISATPWARVTVVGRPDHCSETPCVLSLPPGRHVLHLDNPIARLSKDVPVTVQADQTVIVNTSLATP